MITIPFQVNEREFEIFIGLGDENIDRMRLYDPARIQVKQFPKPFCDLELCAVTVGFVNDEDVAKIAAMPSVSEVMKYLHRGWTFNPKAGDSDEKYKSLKT